jgi:hypothetical protein
METESTKDYGRRPTVYKKQDFDTYVLWKSLPSFLRGQPRVVLEKFGLTDDLVLELLQIKTQTEFSVKFGIKDLGTLTDWNKRIDKDGLINPLNSWARKLTPNVVFALYKNITKNGRAQEVKAWYEIIENN